MNKSITFDTAKNSLLLIFKKPRQRQGFIMNRLETDVKNGDICYESESYKKQREKTLQMSNNGNENQAVRSNGLLDDFETNMVCRYAQYLNSDRLTWGFQNRFGPENWAQSCNFCVQCHILPRFICAAVAWRCFPLKHDCLVSHFPAAVVDERFNWKVLVGFFEFVLEIARIMFKNYDNLRKDVLQIVLSVVILYDITKLVISQQL